MIKLYTPAYRELAFRRQMLADEATMSYNHAWGGTIEWPEAEWADWYDYWVENPEDKCFYRYLQDAASGEFVGEIAYHFRNEMCMADIIVYAPFRGKGYGREGLQMLCDAAKEAGITDLYDDIALGNPARELFLKLGFTEEYRTDEIIMLRRRML